MQVNIYHSNDYAGLDAGKFQFYYGYEATDPKNNDMWCFQVKENGQEVFNITRSEIEHNTENHQLDSAQDYLIAGIGIWLVMK